MFNKLALGVARFIKFSKSTSKIRSKKFFKALSFTFEKYDHYFALSTFLEHTYKMILIFFLKFVFEFRNGSKICHRILMIFRKNLDFRHATSPTKKRLCFTDKEYSFYFSSLLTDKYHIIYFAFQDTNNIDVLTL